MIDKNGTESTFELTDAELSLVTFALIDLLPRIQEYSIGVQDEAVLVKDLLFKVMAIREALNGMTATVTITPRGAELKAKPKNT